MKYKPLLAFMLARHEIYLVRARGEPWPWTTDSILRTYKFTNVYRELDRVTIWIRENVREPFADHPNLWFMLAIARQVNWPESLADLVADRRAWPYTNSWSWERFRAVLNERAAKRLQVYTGAYMLNAHGFEKLNTPDRDKPLFTAKLVLQSVWERRKRVEPLLHNTMEQAVTAFLPYHGWGGFTAYEVVCDLRHTRYLRDAKDVCTWAHAGPGAKRGINRLRGLPPKTPLADKSALGLMVELYNAVSPLWPHSPPLELREIEHSLCEFDKYERTRLGEGRPRSRYNTLVQE